MTVTTASKSESSSASASSKKTSDSLRSLKLRGYVGFDKIADQQVNKITKSGFAFNILCIGDTGIGKSTLMNTLFNTDFNLEPSAHTKKEVELCSNTFELAEKNIKLKLTLIETSGFGDQINKERSHEPIVKYVNDQYEAFLQRELGIGRDFEQANDSTVHLCLYFISPTGHSLKAIDLTTMKSLDRKVNVMPIIAKADTVSKYELNEFKKRIMKDLTENNVNVYQFPVNDSDLEISNVNAAANALYPLAVIGSSELVKIGSKFTKGRSYEWGTVSVENEAHCDFVKLRDMVLSTNMIDLIERTHTKHYQVYRARRLQEMGFKDGDIQALDEKGEELFVEKKGRNVFEVYNLKRIELEELVQRREFEIKEDFVRKVKNKEMELRESEKELNVKYNKFREEQSEWTGRLDKKQHELDAMMKQFNERKFAFEKSRTMTLSSQGDKKKKHHK